MLKTRLVNICLTLAIIAGLVVTFGLILPQLARLTPSRTVGNTPVILQQVQTLSQLVTVKYVMEKVVDLQDVQPYKDMIVQGWGENRVLMIAHGVVKAGVDLSEITNGDVQVSGKKIILKLPPSRVTDRYLDDKQTQIVERTTGLLRSFDKDLEQDARRQAVMDIDRAAREAGILKDADERARLQLKSLFLQMGFEDVEFRGP
ncbi:MAG TPA: DUF4230 domain-containing protein [Verrucomicrobiae bacterium]|jgi:hypothetical protein|nr:DUF4230 domain-containing protein [Verrucomicrobiae bacterium]